LDTPTSNQVGLLLQPAYLFSLKHPLAGAFFTNLSEKIIVRLKKRNDYYSSERFLFLRLSQPSMILLAQPEIPTML
jgi:hypothetical protein